LFSILLVAAIVVISISSAWVSLSRVSTQQQLLILLLFIGGSPAGVHRELLRWKTANINSSCCSLYFI